MQVSEQYPYLKPSEYILYQAASSQPMEGCLNENIQYNQLTRRTSLEYCHHKKRHTKSRQVNAYKAQKVGQKIRVKCYARVPDTVSIFVCGGKVLFPA